LINDVLDISKIEAGRMELRLSENAIKDCIEAVKNRVAPLAEEKGLELLAEFQTDLPFCTFDLKRITQVPFNLTGNAIKFTNEGEIRIGAKTKGENLLCWVSDTGIGIPQSELGSIFSEFQQVDSSIDREAQGSGLGLAIVKRFIEMHGGEIWAESEVGVGSTFWFTIPLKRKK
jgi:signal transduction histidine kinase